MRPQAPETYQGLPVVTAERMRELDRLALERGLPTLELMENAGRAVAAETAAYLKEVLGREAAGAAIVVCCGRGSNGGDGLVAARILQERGAPVSVFICPPRKPEGGGPGEYPEPVRVNLKRAGEAGVFLREAGPEAPLRKQLGQSLAVLDALLGTGSRGKPAGAVHHMIREMAQSKKPVLSIDLPSGLDPDTGECGGAVVAAVRTFTLGLPKRGLLAPHAKKYVGELKVLDIGYPPELLRGT